MQAFSTFSGSLFEAFFSPLPHLWLKARDHAILSIGTLLGLIMLYAAHYLTSPYHKLPPGPRGYPIIGNVFELGEGQWLHFTELQKKYGQLLLLSPPFPISEADLARRSRLPERSWPAVNHCQLSKSCCRLVR